MAIQRNYVVGIIDYEKIGEVNEVIFSYSDVTEEYTSYMYFAKQPLNSGEFVPDATFFQLKAENESSLNKKINNLIKDLDALTADYVLKDEESGKLLSVVEFGGTLFVKFDNLKIINKGTFKQIDDLKQLKTDFGYCRGFKANFRPLEGKPIDDLKVNPEIIYLISDSSENLSKFREYVSERVIEIDPKFEVDFVHFRKI